MPRPVTLFTGQWADLPLSELAPLAKEMGYDGLELACMEWEDGRMDRVHGATESAAFVRGLDFPASAAAFDAAYDKDTR